MDIKDILDSLGIDLTNPEAKRGAIEAIQAILNSRTPPPDLGGAGGGMAPSGEVEVEIDPDLIQPSQKFNQPGSDEDIEIDDEEDILSQVKHNKSEDELDNDGNADGDDSSGSDSDSSSTSDDSSESNSDRSSDSDEDNSSEGDTQENDNLSKPDEAGDETDASSNSSSESENSDEEETDTDEQGTKEADDFYDDDESEEDEDDSEASKREPVDFEDESEEEMDKEGDEEESEEAEYDEDEDNFEDEESEEEDEFDFDEDDLLDDELKNSYDDQEIQSKHEARKLKRERTLAAAKAALEKAKTKNVAPALIRELEKSIEALESLTEAKAKSLQDMSDEEFNLMVNRVFDAISAVGDTELTFTTDEERELRAQEIKTDLGSRETQQELSDEDIAAIRAETQAVKAREKETAIYRKPASGSFKGFQEFLNSLYRAIALQVQTNEVQDDTWSAINRRYSGTGVLKQGQRKNDLPDRKIPVIDFYFDQSGSWSSDDIKVGMKAVSALADMDEKGQIKLNVFYFADEVSSTPTSGGTSGWNEIVKNVIVTQATNVVIMTDSDMQGWWSPQNKPPLKYTVPGYVWYLWRDGESAPRLPQDLKGRGGVQQFSFNRGDVQ